MIIEQLKAMSHFSPTEQIIAQYIINHGEKVSFMTIQDLAKETYSSNVTIIRLCKKLGCDGFKDFKIRYIKEIESTKENDYLDMSRPFFLGEGSSKVMQSMVNVYSQMIQTCINSVKVEDLEKIADMIVKSNRVFVFAIGDSAIRGRSFINRLIKLNIFAHNAMSNREETAISINATSKDVALFISYSGAQISFPECVKILKHNHCPIVSITSEVNTSLTRNSDISIQFPQKEYISDTISTFYSQIAFDFILNTLYSLIYASNYSKHHETKRIIDSHGYYMKSKIEDQ